MVEITPEMQAALGQLAEVRLTARDGRISGRLCFTTTLFFEDGGTAEGQSAAIGAFFGLARESAAGFVAAQAPSGSLVGCDPDALEADALEAVARGFARPLDHPMDAPGMDIGLWSVPRPGRAGGDMPPPSATLVMGPAFIEGQPRLSELVFNTEITEIGRVGPEPIIARVLAAAKRLRPIHGLAGFSIHFNQVTYSDTDGLASFPAIKRFPGLHCAQNSAFVSQPMTSLPGPMSVNWLTILGDTMIARLPEGGLAALPETCPVTHYEGGVLIRAGALPQTGDDNQGLSLAPLNAVARLLEDVLFTDYNGPLFAVPQPLEMMDETRAWVRRFN